MMPAAYSTHRVSRFPFPTRVISGCELLGNVTIQAGGRYIVTCNPAYWIGTYVSKQAAQYSQYLPLSITIEYRPFCATSTSGIVTFGTKWHNDMPEPEASLLTTPGGHSAAPYAPFAAHIPLRGMSRKMYDLDVPLGPDSSPFSFMWCLSGTPSPLTMAGQFFVRYRFRFFNTNTSPMTYMRNLALASTVLNDQAYSNCIIETLSEMPALPSDSENAIPWLKIAVAVGTFIAQNFDAISSIARWVIDRLVVAQAKRNAGDTVSNDGEGLVAATPNQYVMVYRQIKPAYTLPVTQTVTEVEERYYVSDTADPGFFGSGGITDRSVDTSETPSKPLITTSLQGRSTFKTPKASTSSLEPSASPHLHIQSSSELSRSATQLTAALSPSCPPQRTRKLPAVTKEPTT